LSALFGFSGSLGGYLLSAALDTSIAGGIATTLGIQFAVVLTLVQLRKK